MEFRVKVYLYHFFIDYRRSCLIYVNKNIKTVRDLMNYISKQFDIDEEFYLTSNDLYLPDFEDIRILHEDDVIVVVPQQSLFKHNIELEKSKKPKKVKKKLVPVGNSTKIVEDDVPWYDEVTIKKKKVIEEDQSMLVDEVDADEVDHTKQELEWKNLAKHYTRKRKIEPLPISTSPRIVKSIVVYDDVPKSLDNEKSEIVSDSDISTSSIKNYRKNIDTDSKLESLTSEVDVDVSKTKRKRKRVRHKRKQVETVPLPIVKRPVLPLVNGTSSAHIRFDDDAVEEPFENINNQQETTEVVETIQLDEGEPTSIVNYEQFCMNEIHKFPLMKSRVPNVNDIIAFKRYKLSENFTPEISNYIIGRVLSFCPESQAVLVKIIEGKDECKDPEGKFFWQQEEEEPAITDEKQFAWTEVVDARLIFP